MSHLCLSLLLKDIQRRNVSHSSRLRVNETSLLWEWDFFRVSMSHLDVDPSSETLSKVDLQPPDQWTKLFLLVCVQLGQLILPWNNQSRCVSTVWCLTWFKLFLIISEVSDYKFVFSCSLFELIRHLLETCQRHQSVVIVLGISDLAN